MLSRTHHRPGYVAAWTAAYHRFDAKLHAPIFSHSQTARPSYISPCKHDERLLHSRVRRRSGSPSTPPDAVGTSRIHNRFLIAHPPRRQHGSGWRRTRQQHRTRFKPLFKGCGRLLSICVEGGAFADRCYAENQRRKPIRRASIVTQTAPRFQAAAVSSLFEMPQEKRSPTAPVISAALSSNAQERTMRCSVRMALQIFDGHEKRAARRAPYARVTQGLHPLIYPLVRRSAHILRFCHRSNKKRPFPGNSSQQKRRRKLRGTTLLGACAPTHAPPTRHFPMTGETVAPYLDAAGTVQPRCSGRRNTAHDPAGSHQPPALCSTRRCVIPIIAFSFKSP